MIRKASMSPVHDGTKISISLVLLSLNLFLLSWLKMFSSLKMAHNAITPWTFHTAGDWGIFVQCNISELLPISMCSSRLLLNWWGNEHSRKISKSLSEEMKDYRVNQALPCKRPFSLAWLLCPLARSADEADWASTTLGMSCVTISLTNCWCGTIWPVFSKGPFCSAEEETSPEYNNNSNQGLYWSIAAKEYM